MNSNSNNAVPTMRSVGFPNSKASGRHLEPRQTLKRPPSRSRQTNASPPPLPREKVNPRSKGSWFIRLFVFSLLGSAIYLAWDHIGRYEAYGYIRGRVINVSSETDGVIGSILVHNEERVKQGQLLAVIENPNFVQQQQKLQLDLDMAIARLTAKATELAIQERKLKQQGIDSRIEYLREFSDLQLEKSRLAKLSFQQETNGRLSKSKSVSQLKLRQTKEDYQATLERVSGIEKTLQLIENKATEKNELHFEELLRPELVQIKQLESDLVDLIEESKRFEIYAPTSGRIINRHGFAGEFARRGEVIFDILEDGSEEAVIFVQQAQLERFQIGSKVRLNIDPWDQLVPCHISRIETQMIEAPERRQKFYLPGEKLVAVVAKPDSSIATELPLLLDSEVRLPRFEQSIYERLNRYFHSQEQVTQKSRVYPGRESL